MKKMVFITGALSLVLFFQAVLFRVFHFPGGQLLLFACLLIFSLLFIPLLAFYLYKHTP